MRRGYAHAALLGSTDSGGVVQSSGVLRHLKLLFASALASWRGRMGAACSLFPSVKKPRAAVPTLSRLHAALSEAGAFANRLRETLGLSPHASLCEIADRVAECIDALGDEGRRR